MANQKKAPRQNEWIATLVPVVVFLFIAITTDVLWLRVLSIVFAVAAVGYSAWLFRREWRWVHSPDRAVADRTT